MNLLDLDGGIHSYDDMAKKFYHTFIYGCVPSLGSQAALPQVMFIDSIGPGGVYLFLGNFDHPHETTTAEEVELILERPQYGIINGKSHPMMISMIPARQWRRGWCDENVLVEDIRGQKSNCKNLGFSTLEQGFRPVYPSFEDAIKTILEGKKKHIALSSDVSVMQGNKRLIFLRNFVPFLTYSGKMFFNIEPCNSLLDRECHQYEALLRNTFGHITFK